jgi:hypothetical protein
LRWSGPVAVSLLLLAGCGSGATTISMRAAEQDAAKARYAVEHIEPAIRECERGHVRISISHTDSACVEPGHAVRQLEHVLKCPAGAHLRVDLGRHDAMCVWQSKLGG